MKIGLVGEAPNDTKSIENILKKKYIDLEFVELLKNKFTGASLENKGAKTALRIECISHKPDIVVFTRDLDGLMTKEYREKRLQRKSYYNDFKGCTQVKKTLFLLHVWEIEALILADINAFNTYYNTKATFDGDPMLIKEPKELLTTYYKKYSESDNSKIFLHSDFKQLHQNCEYFKKFIDDFDKLLEQDINP
ncbi:MULTISPECIES: hypothetical protein [unclassified Myroides]|uniref:hypothetical protein n=1 Tax=unclassified Myroides TaxID=2642485 RepID=UPI003D2F8D0F